MIDLWEAVFLSPWWWLARIAVTTGVVSHFFYTWGWGDASYGDNTTDDGDAAVHIGLPDDEWHRRRRRAFRAVSVMGFLPVGLFFVDIGFLVALACVGLASRRAFRQGVYDADRRKFRQWFGEGARPLFPGKRA